jgi:hypothetical protein
MDNAMIRIYGKAEGGSRDKKTVARNIKDHRASRWSAVRNVNGCEATHTGPLTTPHPGKVGARGQEVGKTRWVVVIGVALCRDLCRGGGFAVAWDVQIEFEATLQADGITWCWIHVPLECAR